MIPCKSLTEISWLLAVILLLHITSHHTVPIIKPESRDRDKSGDKIAILSQDASLYSTSRLREAGEEQGHQMRVIPYLRCYMNITSSKPSIIFNGNPLPSR